MKEVERAYLAGLFDGEGCASVVYSQNMRMTKQGMALYQTFSVYCIISNDDRRVLQEVRFLSGNGGIYKQKTSYTFRVCKTSDVIEIIETIKPYIRVKKQDLQNLESAARFIMKLRGLSTRHTWTEEETKKFQEYVWQSKAMKVGGRRGRPRKHPLKQ